MRILGNNSDLPDRFEVIVDRDAQPADLDDALADFLLACVKRESLVATRASTTDGATRTEADE